MTTRPAPSQTPRTAPVTAPVIAPVADGPVDWSAVLADLSDAVVERAALYLAGALDDAERDAAEVALRSSAVAAAPFRAAVAALQGAALALGEGAGAAAGFQRVSDDELPSPVVRARVLASIASPGGASVDDVRPRPEETHSHASQASHVWGGWDSDQLPAGLFTLRREERGWEETGVDGVQVRRLFVDRPNNRMTAMFRMAPGTDYPEHVHNGFEECYVLEGELHVGDELVMNAGDYQRADGGSEHARQWTKSGCVLLVSTSMSDSWT